MTFYLLQALWGASGDEIVFVGWDQEPYRIGLRFCTDRKSYLYKTNIKGGDIGKSISLKKCKDY